jgi:tRNA A58 N-methylase Trm61
LDRLIYTDAAAAGYGQAMARISRHFVPLMMDAGHLAAGHRLLDVATGTGLVAEAALGVVGPTGHVTAVDISPGRAIRQTVREDIRQSVGDTGGPIDIDVQYRFASGRK